MSNRSYTDKCNACGAIRQLIPYGDSRVCRKCIEGDGVSGYDYRDGQAFKDYAAMIEAVIHSLPETEDLYRTHVAGEINIRELHERLDFRANRQWTQDALDSLRSVEAVGTLITRYRKVIGAKPKYKDRWNGDGMRWIFAGAAHQERDANFRDRLGEQPSTQAHQI